jgi:DNA end-binding protein Ku
MSQAVVVEERELNRMAPPSSRVMEIREFVPTAEVDPVYLDMSYYVEPETAGEKPYTLLYEALRRSAYTALAQWTLHSREHLALLRPGRCGLLLHTLFYADEVRERDEFRSEVEWVTPRELELATLLVESMAARFEPHKYRDHYRENLRALLDAKIRGEELRLEASSPLPAPVPDILKALQASLARGKKPTAGAGRSPAHPVELDNRTKRAWLRPVLRMRHGARHPVRRL